MTVSVSTLSPDVPGRRKPQSSHAGLYALGAIAALLIVITALAEMLITMLPGGYAVTETVSDWFALLHSQPLMGLRNLGLLNIILTSLGIPLTFAVYRVHREANPPLADLGFALALVGTAIFFATNRVLPMLGLSLQYAAASADQKALIEVAGQALLAVGQSHTPGTFLAFFFSEVAGILIGLLVLRGRLFRPAAAIAGITGYSFLALYEILVSFVPALHDAALILAVIGGLGNITWYILAALGFLQLRKAEKHAAQ